VAEGVSESGVSDNKGSGRALKGLGKGSGRGYLGAGVGDSVRGPSNSSYLHELFAKPTRPPS